MKNYQLLLNILTLLFILPFSSNATTFKAQASASWHLVSTWDQIDKLPGAGDTVVIKGYHVTFDNNAGNVTIKRLKIISDDTAPLATSLTIGGSNTLIVTDELLVRAPEDANHVDLIVQDSVNFRVIGPANFIRAAENTTNKRLQLYLLGNATMTVDNDFTYLYRNSAAGESSPEIILESDAKLNVVGSTYLTSKGGKELSLDLRDSSEIIISGNLVMDMTGGENFLVGSSSPLSNLQINGNATLTNSGGTGTFALGSGINNGSLTVNGNLELNSTAINRMAMFSLSGSSAVVEVKGDISLNAISDSSAQIIMNDNSILKLGGDLHRPTNFGILNMDSTSTLELNGTNSQEIPKSKLANAGTDSLLISNLSLKNTSSAPLILKGDLIINDSLTLSKGNIITHDTAMLYIEDNAFISGGSDTAYIEGPMVKLGRTNNQNFTFPIGSASNYAPISISSVSNTSSEIKAEYFGDPPPWGDNLTASINNVNTNNYWSIEKNSGANVNVTLHWDENIASGITEMDDLVVARLNETSSSEIWENYGNSLTTGTNTSGTVTSNLVMGDPPPWGDAKFTLGSVSALNVLPVELTKFQAIQQSTQVYMQWETASELNTSYFEIERSNDISNFETIGRIVSAGNTNETQNYKTIDIDPKDGLNYYRLKIVDNDGSFEYSHIEVVKFDAAPAIELFPNPVKNIIQLKIDDLDSQESTIEIFDRNGRLLFMNVLDFENGKLQLDSDKINVNENGTYFIRITGKAESQVLKFIKIN